MSHLLDWTQLFLQGGCNVFFLPWLFSCITSISCVTLSAERSTTSLQTSFCNRHTCTKFFRFCHEFWSEFLSSLNWLETLLQRDCIHGKGKGSSFLFHDEKCQYDFLVHSEFCILRELFRGHSLLLRTCAARSTFQPVEASDRFSSNLYTHTVS